MIRKHPSEAALKNRSNCVLSTSHVLKFLSPVKIYVHLQLVAILCIGYLGVRTVAWKFGNFHIRDCVCDHVNLSEGKLK